MTSALVGVALSAALAAPAVLEVGRFSAATPGEVPPPGWEPLRFPRIERATDYRLQAIDGVVVVHATSRGAASGWIRKLRIDAREYPLVEWRWKIDGLIEGSDVRKKSGDDYPARLYVAFEYEPSRASVLEKAKFEAARLYYGEYPPGAAINYIWEARAPLGTVVPNPYTARAMMIVVESGRGRVGTWVTEQRNLLEDFRGAFGHDPPPISGVAIMTDTDDTGASASASYGDVVFRRPQTTQEK
ncbi:MAG: hypothetical protein QOD06_1612 [Candidatus Binatota bacterium]|nr:hypothetical protein [Candidatus Binatota bacterium]